MLTNRHATTMLPVTDVPRARRFYEAHGATAVEFTDGEGNEEKTPDVRYEWKPSA